jgi:hypothetical protein
MSYLKVFFFSIKSKHKDVLFDNIYYASVDFLQLLSPGSSFNKMGSVSALHPLFLLRSSMAFSQLIS